MYQNIYTNVDKFKIRPKYQTNDWMLLQMKEKNFIDKFKPILLHIVLLKCHHVQIAFLKFTSCDNQALVGCIPIPAVVVDLNLKS